MAENEQDSDQEILEDFELSSELSALVENNVIPKKIARRLEVRLKEKKVKITRKQLNQLAEKIRDIMREYVKDLPENQRKAVMGEIKTPEPAETDDKTKDMLETIKKLQGKISDLESSKKTIDETTSSEEIETPDKSEEIEPTTEIKKPDITGQPQEEKKDLISPETKSSITTHQPKERPSDPASPRIVTTEDVNLPGKPTNVLKEWNLDPLMEIPGDTESVIILMKWLQSLIDKCGRPNLSNILDYYVDIGWISDDVKISLIDYSQGITGEEKFEKTAKEISDLPSKDHIESLLFIQKLKGKQFDKHFIDRIEGEISRITKKVDSYNTK